MPFMLILRKGTTELPCNTLIISYIPEMHKLLLPSLV